MDQFPITVKAIWHTGCRVEPSGDGCNAFSQKPDSVINVRVEFGDDEGKELLDNIAKRAESYKPKECVAYKMIKEYIEAKYGLKVHTAYIAKVNLHQGGAKLVGVQ